MSNIFIIAVIIVLLIIALLGLYMIINNTFESNSNTKINATKEGFNAIGPKLGNLIAYSTTSGELKRPLPDIEGRNIIRLSNNFKITGFKFDAPNETTKKYRLFIAGSLEQILNPRLRIPLVLGGNSDGYDFNKLYNDSPDFEKANGDAYFIGSYLAIEMMPGDSSWPEITGYQIFGLNQISPSLAEYKGYIPLGEPKLQYDKTGSASTDPQNIIKVFLVDNKNKMVGKISLSDFPFDITNYSPQLRARFRNDLDAGRTTLFAINGPIRDQYINTPNSANWDIYLERPVMANYIEIEMTDSKNVPIAVSTTDSNNVLKETKVSLFGYTPSERDINNYKLQGGIPSNQSQINIGGTKCPPTAEMLNKQVQAQLICEALEYKDREKNKRLAYERDKLYLQKLKSQEDEIRGLEGEIGELIKRKNELASKSTGTSIDELEKELKSAEAARKQAEDYLKAKDVARDGLRLKFNLDPQFQQLLTPQPS